MSRKAEISLPTITTKQSPLVSQQRSTYLIKHALKAESRREKRGRKQDRVTESRKLTVGEEKECEKYDFPLVEL